MNQENRYLQGNKGKEGGKDKASAAQGNGEKDEEAPRVSSTPCKPIAKERPRIELSGHKIDKRIEYLWDHALIGKFIGFWPTERALYGWIVAKWKPKVDVTL